MTYFKIFRILFHTKWLLQQHGGPPQSAEDGDAPESAIGQHPEDAAAGDQEGEEEDEGDTSGWYEDGNPVQTPPHPNPMAVPRPQIIQAPPHPNLMNKKSRHPGFGWPKTSNQMQWTPAGWVVKDNSHKVKNDL